LSFALAQLPIGFAEFSVGFSEALREVLAVLLVLFAWLLDWKVKALHSELPTSSNDITTGGSAGGNPTSGSDSNVGIVDRGTQIFDRHWN
jgi:hypothetical protein